MTRVLVVEDSATQAEELRLILEPEGFEVEIAADGEIGLARFNESTFDVVLSDILMPGLNGYDLCRRIKATAKGKQTPVILLTTLGDPMDIIDGLECGADNFITKPYSPEPLVNRIRGLLANRAIRTERRLRTGVEVMFMGKTFTITSDKEQILDLLISTFEDVVRTNRELQARQGQLAQLQQELERKVEERTAALEAEIHERELAEEHLRQVQKLEAVGRLAGGIAHDFNNLLTAILGYATLVLDQLGEQHPLRPDVDEIRKAGERAASLTQQLLAFGRKQIVQPVVLDLNAVVRDVDSMLRRLIREDIELRIILAEELAPVRIDPGQIQQVLLNLAVNARDAMPGGGKLTIETANVELDEAYAREHVAVVPGRYVMLAVSDTGGGMDAETQAHAFEPFFTTKERGKGTGLGLATVYGIVKQSGGNIWLYSEPNHGATFKIYLPTVEGAVAQLEPRVATTERVGGSETVLLVEDEESVRALARQVLTRSGYTVLEALNGDEALLVAQKHSGPIHLLLTDVVMPGMSGREMAQRLHSQHPGVKVLYISGYTDNAIVHHGMLAPGLAFLQKPFTPDGLARRVREVLDA